MNKKKNDGQKPDSGSDLYAQLGVASDKSDVKANFEEIITKEYPYAFVNIATDPSNPNKRITMHADGDGSKLIQRFLDYYYYEGENEEIFAGMVDDALAMNTSDIAAAGFVFGAIRLVDIFDCGNAKLKGVIAKQIKKRFKELLDLYTAYGFDIKFMGGETADLPYQVKTGVFNVVVTAWADQEDIITGETRVGNVILGVHSDGRAIWENQTNSGCMSNGQTLLRSGTMDPLFNGKYPDLGDGVFYKGKYFPGDCPVILGGMSVGEAILSPTRQWPIVIRAIIKELNKQGILFMLSGITINTGGGATKIANIGHGVTYVKNMPEPSPLFRFIQEETGQAWKHMFTTFNCGIGIDIVGENSTIFKSAVELAVKRCGLQISRLGFVRHSRDEKNHVMLCTPYGRFEY